MPMPFQSQPPFPPPPPPLPTRTHFADFPCPCSLQVPNWQRRSRDGRGWRQRQEHGQGRATDGGNPVFWYEASSVLSPEHAIFRRPRAPGTLGVIENHRSLVATRVTRVLCARDFGYVACRLVFLPALTFNFLGVFFIHLAQRTIQRTAWPPPSPPAWSLWPVSRSFRSGGARRSPTR